MLKTVHRAAAVCLSVQEDSLGIRCYFIANISETMLSYFMSIRLYMHEERLYLPNEGVTRKKVSDMKLSIKILI